MIPNQEVLDARILIIDDTQANVTMLEKMLDIAGYTSVLGITDSREVMGIYESFQPDIVLLDINMPHLNGYQVMEKINEVKKDAYLPILVLTAQQDKETCYRALHEGAKDFLTKPFDQTEALIRIQNMLETKFLHKQVAYQNTLLEQKVEARTQELHHSRLEIIRRLSLAAEYKDSQTGLHIIRMSKMCELIGRAFGMSDQEADLLLNSSPMHDIGKLGIPDNLLLKPGKLEPDEYEIIKTHTLIGAKLLDNPSSQLMYMAREIALSHHERWDGAGYPHRLKGAEIPLPARIAAVADCFDALTSVRSYKEQWNMNDAVKYIQSNKGSHFDPELVDVFDKIKDDIIAIKTQK